MHPHSTSMALARSDQFFTAIPLINLRHVVIGFTLVDVADAPRISLRSWCAQRTVQNGRTYTSYARSHTAQGPTLLLHRVIVNAPTGWDVDHRNGMGLDNRSANLRIVRPADNTRNRQRNRHSAHPYKGIRRGGRGKDWRAQIRVGGTRIHLGYFATAEDAARAYNAAAQRFFGQYARLNDLDDASP